MWRGLGDPGSVLNQQLMLDNRFTGISQRFGENEGVEYYSAYSHKDCLNCLVYKDETDKAPLDFRLSFFFYDYP